VLVGIATILAFAYAASILQQQSTNVIIVGAVILGGIFAWRQKRGDFYKAVAEEKNDENRDLKRERDRLRAATDITPIMETLNQVVQALDRHAKLTEQVFEKVADMNGSLRAHGEAMKALADHLILDEAARGLLKAAAQAPTAPHRRLRGTQ
jgi:hypothetical protein